MDVNIEMILIVFYVVSDFWIVSANAKFQRIHTGCLVEGKLRRRACSNPNFNRIRKLEIAYQPGEDEFFYLVAL